MKTVPLESEEQTALINWCFYMANRYPALNLIYAIPNGGSRNSREAHNLKLQGVKPGVPDLCLPIAQHGYNALYIEMKRIKGGTLSEEQKAWRKALNDAGNLSMVAHGFEEAKTIICSYLDIK